MGFPSSFKTSAVMLSFPGALFRFSGLMAALTSVGSVGPVLMVSREWTREGCIFGCPNNV